MCIGKGDFRVSNAMRIKRYQSFQCIPKRLALSLPPKTIMHLFCEFWSQVPPRLGLCFYTSLSLKKTLIRPCLKFMMFLFHFAHFMRHSKKHFFDQVNLILKALLQTEYHHLFSSVQITSAIKIGVLRWRNILKHW